MNVIKIYKRENVGLGLKIIHRQIRILRLSRAFKAQCNGFLKIRDSNAKSLSPEFSKKKRENCTSFYFVILFQDSKKFD
jgi:hypothetical protein